MNPGNKVAVLIVNGFIKDFTNKLVQSKLKWSQECLISDLKFNVYQAYLGNEPIEMLLDLTCLQAKEIFKKSIKCLVKRILKTC